MNLPNGVQKMSGQIPGLVETSLNLGILKLEPDHLHACASVRSSVGSAKEALSDKLEYLIGFLGGEFHVEGAYPAWEYKEDSALRDLMVVEYEAMYGQKPAVEAIHAGLECGLFYEKLSGLDCVSFGPNMKAIHDRGAAFDFLRGENVSVPVPRSGAAETAGIKTARVYFKKFLKNSHKTEKTGIK